MHILRWLILLSISFLLVFQASAQDNRLNKGHVMAVGISIAVLLPGGDLDNRYGVATNLGGNLEFMTNKSNWIIGAGGGFTFGNTVKQDVLSGLRTADGGIIALDGNFADIQLRQRGYFLGGHVGKLIGLIKRNPRSGIRITLGFGVMEHKIRITNDPNRSVAQLSNEYKKGYDRLSRGFALQQFVGYQLLSSNKLMNFFAGFEFTQGFTENKRAYNFDLGQPGASSRLDLTYGIRVGWILPFYFGKGSEEINY